MDLKFKKMPNKYVIMSDIFAIFAQTVQDKRQGLSKHGNLAKRPKQALKHLASFDKRAV